MTNALKLLISAAISTGLSHLIITSFHIGDEKYSAINSGQIIEAKGLLRFIPGHRGSVPFLEVNENGSITKVACPRSYQRIPCDQPQVMFSIITGKEGKIRYQKYNATTVSSGIGDLISIQMINENQMIEPPPNGPDKISLIVVFAAIFSISFFVSYSLINLIFRKNHGKT